jgi:hypothetical protein
MLGATIIEGVALSMLGTNLSSFSIIIGVTGLALSSMLVLFGENAKAFNLPKKTGS